MSDFLKKNLAEIELSFEKIKPKNLVIPAGKVYLLSRTDPKEAGVTWIRGAYTKVTPKSWDHIKQIVGINNSVAGEILRGSQPQIGIDMLSSSDEALRRKELSINQLKALSINDLKAKAYEIARLYVYSDSREFRDYLQILDAVIPARGFDIIIPVFLNITIERNGVLRVARNIQTLYANDIRIGRGGKIESLPDVLSVKCNSIIGKL
jgi:hypothetical protein